MASVPVIDMAAEASEVAERIQAACHLRGFFYVTGHGVPADLVAQMADASAESFAPSPGPTATTCSARCPG